jgi:hypothetical protein
MLALAALLLIAAGLTPAAFHVDTIRGLASWCAPTPRYCHGWDKARLAAVPSFRNGDKPYLVRVCSATRCTVARVVSFCACGNHVIDLSPPAFRNLAPLSRGVVRVTVTRVELPATDTVPSGRRHGWRLLS